MRKKHWLVPLVAIIGIGAITPSYLRVYRVAGSSDAPSFLVGDRILVSKVAYDLRLPYSSIVIFSHSQPERGEVVLFRPPGEDHAVLKRVIGLPGDTVLMHENHLEINGVALKYERVDEGKYESVARHNHLGAVVEKELANGPAHLITHTPDTRSSTMFGPVRVGPENYYVMGDNRDNSLDSRAYGTIPRNSILGKVVGGQRAAP